MSTKDLHELLRLINRLELAEFKMKEGDFSLSVRTKHFPSEVVTVASAPTANYAPAQVAAPAAAAPAPAAAAQAAPAPSEAPAAATDESRYVAIKSPMVGTFYRSASPDKPAYVKIGDTITAGSTICIIEAMKLFNEVDAEISGKIVKVMVEDASPVEYDQVLFLVDPKG